IEASVAGLSLRCSVSGESSRVVDLTADDDVDAHIDEIEEASSTAEVTARAEIAVTLTDSDSAETDVTLSDTEVETVTDGESHQ
ncbi:E3 Ubiquitin-Protein Ligase Arkadia, partial [Manis pentadactyla]